MKYILLLLAITCQVCYAQTSPSAGTTPTIDVPSNNLLTTTEEEYNYVTRGYAKDVADGRDIKGGYKLGESWTYVKAKATVTITAFVRIKDNKPCAYIIQTSSTDLFGKNSTVLCLPINNKALYQKHFLEIANINATLKDAYTEALLVRTSWTF